MKVKWVLNKISGGIEMDVEKLNTRTHILYDFLDELKIEGFDSDDMEFHKETLRELLKELNNTKYWGGVKWLIK